MDVLEKLYSLRLVRVLNYGLGSVSGKRWKYLCEEIK
jgi:hypothetical protein